MAAERIDPAPAAVERLSAATVAVWHPWVRTFHWSLVAAIALSWLTHEGAGLVHHVAGYAALALIIIRALLGFISRSPYTRFSSFVLSPRATWSYARDVAARREERFLGHNPLGGWMIVALMTTVAVISISGWLYTTDAYWGVAWVGNLHEWSADLLLWLIGLHVLGVLLTSWHHGENLISAMIFGRKRV